MHTSQACFLWKGNMLFKNKLITHQQVEPEVIKDDAEFLVDNLQKLKDEMNRISVVLADKGYRTSFNSRYVRNVTTEHTWGIDIKIEKIQSIKLL